MGRTSGESASIAHLEAIETAVETAATDGATRTAAVATAAHQVTQNTKLDTLATAIASTNTKLDTTIAHIAAVREGGASYIRIDDVVP